MSEPSPSSPAFEAEEYRVRVTRYIRYLLHGEQEAEDLTQETLLRISATIQPAGPAAMEGWIYRIATHICLDRLRQRKRTSGHHVDLQAEELPIIDLVQPSPFAVIQQSEMSDCINRYVSNLKDAYKAVVLLHDADGLTSEETARLLHLPLTTVKMRLHRGRQRLIAALKSSCEFSRDDRGVLICEPKPTKR